MDTGEIAREETTRQLVILGFSIIGTLAFFALMELSTKDKRRTMKMWSARAVKRSAQSGADFLQDVAGWAATVYNKEKA